MSGTRGAVHAGAIGLLCALVLPALAFAAGSLDDAEQAVLERRYEDAIIIRRDLAQRDSAEAAYRLGSSYRAGRGVARDDAEAVRWLEIAAQQGHHDAQFNLAAMHENAWGVPIDREQALHWYREAARRGHVRAAAKLEAAGAGAASLAPMRFSASAHTPTRRLHQAIALDDLLGAQRALDAGALPGDPHATGRTPLTDALDRGRFEVLALLLRSGADLNALDGLGDSPLTLAARNGDVGAVEWLLTRGAGANSADRHGATALTLAVQLGHRRVVSALLRAGADANATDATGRSPLAMARAFEHTAIAAALRGAGARPAQSARDPRAEEVGWLQSQPDADAAEAPGSYNGWSPLAIAASRGQPELVRALLVQETAIDARDPEGHTALSRAASRGRTACVEALLAAGANADEGGDTGWTPLLHAVAGGHAAAAVALLDAGADPEERTEDGDSALDLAARSGDGKLVEWLASAPGTHATQHARALSLAATSGNAAGIRALLRRTPPPVGIGDSRAAALCEAADAGHGDIVQALLEAGTPSTTRCADREPLLHHTLRADPALVAMLLRWGVDIDARNTKQNTALMIAARSGAAELVEILLRHGAEIDLRGHGRCTALMAAAAAGQRYVVARLLRAGADTDLRDRDGENALALARAHGHETIVALLESRDTGGFLSRF